jgi:hypothetical protein
VRRRRALLAGAQVDGFASAAAPASSQARAATQTRAQVVADAIYNRRRDVSDQVDALPSDSLTVEVHTTPTPRKAEPNLLAISREWDNLEQYTQTDEALQAFSYLFLQLGPSPVMRVGGRSQEVLTAVPPLSAFVAMRTLRDAVGMRYIIGLPLEQRNVKLARDIMATAQSYLGNSIIAFELGNEPGGCPDAPPAGQGACVWHARGRGGGCMCAIGQQVGQARRFGSMWSAAVAAAVAVVNKPSVRAARLNNVRVRLQSRPFILQPYGTTTWGAGTPAASTARASDCESPAVHGHAAACRTPLRGAGCRRSTRTPGQGRAASRQSAGRSSGRLPWPPVSLLPAPAPAPVPLRSYMSHFHRTARKLIPGCDARAAPLSAADPTSWWLTADNEIIPDRVPGGPGNPNGTLGPQPTVPSPTAPSSGGAAGRNAGNASNAINAAVKAARAAANAAAVDFAGDKVAFNAQGRLVAVPANARVAVNAAGAGAVPPKWTMTKARRAATALHWGSGR